MGKSTQLRIGVLGASRIAPDALLGPAATLGHRVVAVAARDRARAEAYAAEHGIERVLDSYQEVIDDPDVDLVYNALPNSLHGPWNRQVAAAGKALLSEKPFARNAAEARDVAAAFRATEAPVLEGFHYYFHPSFQYTMATISAGEIGELREIRVQMSMPTPPAADPRWSYELAGGAVMDLGCYAAHVLRTVGARLDLGCPRIVGASAQTHDDPQVDASCDFQAVYDDGVTATAHVSMIGDHFDFTTTYVGDAGSVHVHDFLGPHRDDRVTVTRADGTATVEHLSPQSTYTTQLAALAEALSDGESLEFGVDDAVANMEMVDAIYLAAGLEPR